MKKIIKTVLIITVGWTVLNGQTAADPELTAPGITPSPGLVDGPATISITLQNESPTAVPYNAFDPTQVVITLNKIDPDLNGGSPVVNVTNGPSWFTWSANCSSGCGTTSAIWVLTGTQNQTIPGISGFPSITPSQTYEFSGLVLRASTQAEALGNNGHGFNANIIPCAFSPNCDAENGPESNNQSIYTFTNGILPVTLISFTAEKEDRTTILNWITATEENNEYFEVLRSKDLEDWHIVGKVPGAGTTNVQQEYSLVDQQPLSGDNYYQLRQVDYNGDDSFSEIVHLRFEGGDGYRIEMYPNPVSGVLQIKNLDLESVTRVRISDVQGRLVGDMPLKSNEIEFSSFHQGLYFIQLFDKNGNTIHRQKILKMN